MGGEVGCQGGWKQPCMVLWAAEAEMVRAALP